MRLLYITSVELNNKIFLGVERKIKAQIEAFNKNNIESEHLNFPPINNNLLSKVNRRINPLSCNSYIDLSKEIDFLKYDILYIRYTLADFTFIRLIKRAKENNPNIKILIEIPTYPYEGEYKSIRKMPILIKDKMFRVQLKKYVDYIVTFSDDTKIYGIDTIHIDNGIDLNNLPLSRLNNLNNNEMNILAVANVSFWHGYDRLIKGISDFYNDKSEKRIVNFYIIGSGLELEKLKEVAKDTGVEKNIHFEGFKSGKDLDLYFDKCDIAVDHLGLHRKGMNKLSSLKSKEYCGRGIPFVLAHNDLAFKDYRYVYKVNDDETNINISELFEFKNEVCGDKNYKNEMRKYSERFNWVNIIKIIKSKIEE